MCVCVCVPLQIGDFGHTLTGGGDSAPGPHVEEKERSYSKPDSSSCFHCSEPRVFDPGLPKQPYPSRL